MRIPTTTLSLLFRYRTMEQGGRHGAGQQTIVVFCKNMIDLSNLFQSKRKGILIGIIAIIVLSIVLLVRSKRPEVPDSMDEITRVVSGVSVNDFYKDAVRVTETNDAILVETDQYQIDYVSEFERFKITIIDPDIELAQKNAEEKLLEILGITKSDACKLQIDEYVATYVDSELAGYSLPTKFCSSE